MLSAIHHESNRRAGHAGRNIIGHRWVRGGQLHLERGPRGCHGENSAGALAHGAFLDQSGGDLARLIALNVTALTRLANAVAPSTQSRPQLGLFFDASIWVSSGPVELSSSLMGMPVALVNALVMAES